MGNIIDTNNVEEIYRCNKVKIPIIYITLIGCPLSLGVLLFGLYRMISTKKKFAFLTSLIILIFSSEIVNIISKLIQLIKYFFDDERDNKDPGVSMDNARGIICQIQISTSMFSDFCSLLATLLLSLRCYDVIKNKERFFDKGNNSILSFVFVISFSIIIPLGLLFYDRGITKDNISYRYDVRDRCSYWCWLAHDPSAVCYAIYILILIFNIIFACKTNNYLKKGYRKLIEENELSSSKDNMSTPLNEINNNSKNSSHEYSGGKRCLTKSERKRISELKLMKAKCLIYPFVTISIWLLSTLYRLFDDLFINVHFDSKDDSPSQGKEKEKEFFNAHPILQFFVQALLVFHCILSAFRGIFYGFSFVVFEEKIFYNFFKKLYDKCLKDDFPDDEEEENNNIIRNTNNVSTSSDIDENKKKLETETGDEKEKVDIETESKDDNESNKVDYVEMDNSDYHYSENN
jgi:hypothetical protein